MNKYRKGTALKVSYGSGTQLALVEGMEKSGRIRVRRYRAATRSWTDPVTIHPIEVLGTWEGKWPRGAKKT
jgi:hypothetical protein